MRKNLKFLDEFEKLASENPALAEKLATSLLDLRGGAMQNAMNNAGEVMQGIPGAMRNAPGRIADGAEDFGNDFMGRNVQEANQSFNTTLANVPSMPMAGDDVAALEHLYENIGKEEAHTFVARMQAAGVVGAGGIAGLSAVLAGQNKEASFVTPLEKIAMISMLDESGKAAFEKLAAPDKEKVLKALKTNFNDGIGAVGDGLNTLAGGEARRLEGVAKNRGEIADDLLAQIKAEQGGRYSEVDRLGGIEGAVYGNREEARAIRQSDALQGTIDEQEERAKGIVENMYGYNADAQEARMATNNMRKAVGAGVAGVGALGVGAAGVAHMMTPAEAMELQAEEDSQMRAKTASMKSTIPGITDAEAQRLARLF